MSRPVLYLDVDGVLNCPGDYQGDYQFHQVDGQDLWVPAGTRERITRLSEVYDPVWATAWLGTAHSAWKEVLGLEQEFPWEYIDFRYLKLPEIIRHAKGRRWAWVDDTALWELDQLGWDKSMVEGKILNPRFDVGMTEDHVDELLEWANV